MHLRVQPVCPRRMTCRMGLRAWATVLLLQFTLGCTASRIAENPVPAPPSPAGEFRLNADRGIQLPNGRLGGGVRLHRIELEERGRVSSRWAQFVWGFDGLLFNRVARIACLRNRVLVFTKEKQVYFACDRDTGDNPAFLTADDPLVREADRTKAWHDTRILDAEPLGEYRQTTIID